MSRDYKARRAAPLDARRLRDFGAGAAAGIALSALACIALSAAQHREAARTAPPAARAVPATSPGSAAPAGPVTTFDPILTHPEQQMPRQQQQLERSAAAKSRP